MMPIDPFPARATEEISDEKRCRFTNAYDVTQPFLRQEIRHFVVIRSAGEPPSCDEVCIGMDWCRESDLFSATFANLDDYRQIIAAAKT